jgi:heat shock protein HslJ
MAAAGFRAAAVAVAIALGSCATPPPPLADLAGTSWRIVLVNDRQTPATGDYSMRFDANEDLSARFGCNSMGGRYRLVGGTLTVRDLVSTLMGCPEPAARFEAEGSAVLRQPMQVSFTSFERMGLSNAAGSIALDPVR